jgi:ribosomal protein L7/L12
LLITDIGKQKIKVVQLLRKVLDLPLQQAMALATGRDIIAGVGPLIKLSHIRDNLVALGASVKFRSTPGKS